MVKLTGQNAVTINSLILAVAFLAMTSCVAAAADATPDEVSGGYVFLRGLGGGYDGSSAGWLASIAWRVRGPITLTLELGESYQTFESLTPGLQGSRSSTGHFMAGPRRGWRQGDSVRPFVQLLLGAVQSGDNYGAGTASFVWQPGLGVDLKVNRLMSVRVQGDCRLFLLLPELRLATSVVFSR